jgi:hypothetical protein
MQRRTTVAWAITALLLAVAAACSGEDESSPSPAAAAGSGGAAGSAGGSAGGAGKVPSIPAAANVYGPENELSKGQAIFLFDAWGTEQLDEWPPADFMLDLMKNEPEVFGNQFEKFGFLPDPSDDFPVGFKRGLVDASKVHETCALCHVAKLADGTLWLGAPNGALDVGRFIAEVDTRWAAAGHPPRLSELGRKKHLGLGPGRVSSESSDYPKLVAADFPPYFSLGKRKHMNYLGTGRNVRTEVYLSVYTFGAGSPNDETAKVPFPTEEKIDTFVAFLGSIEAPPAPMPQQPDLVPAGEAVFNSAGCASCHHPEDVSLLKVVTIDRGVSPKERRPGEDPMFPNGSILTDPLHRVLIDGDGSAGASGAGGGSGIDDGYADLIAFIFGHKLQATATDGYRTLDLHGIWATAPYLHNGSVPTLEDLLKPASQRPTTFQRGDFTVDTTVEGNGNMGHEFGTDLPDADKTALIAYLKSLLARREQARARDERRRHHHRDHHRRLGHGPVLPRERPRLRDPRHHRETDGRQCRERHLEHRREPARHQRAREGQQRRATSRKTVRARRGEKERREHEIAHAQRRGHRALAGHRKRERHEEQGAFALRHHVRGARRVEDGDHVRRRRDHRSRQEVARVLDVLSDGVADRVGEAEKGEIDGNSEPGAPRRQEDEHHQDRGAGARHPPSRVPRQVFRRHDEDGREREHTRPRERDQRARQRMGRDPRGHRQQRRQEHGGAPEGRRQRRVTAFHDGARGGASPRRCDPRAWR